MGIMTRTLRPHRRCHRRFKKRYAYVIDIDGNVLAGKALGDINSFWFGKKLLFHPDSWHKYAYYPSLFIGVKEPLPLTLKLLEPLMETFMGLIRRQFEQNQPLYAYFMKEGKYKPIVQGGGRQAPIMNYIRPTLTPPIEDDGLMISDDVLAKIKGVVSRREGNIIYFALPFLAERVLINGSYNFFSREGMKRDKGAYHCFSKAIKIISRFGGSIEFNELPMDIQPGDYMLFSDVDHNKEQ